MFRICPRCHRGYWMPQNEYFDRVIQCKGKNEDSPITVTWHRVEHLTTPSTPKSPIVIKSTFRPVTR